MADTADSIASLIRFIADDQEIQFLDTAVQLAPINAGWREFQRRLALAGSPLMRRTAVLLVPANTTIIGPTPPVTGKGAKAPSALVLPADFVMPYRLAERPSTAPMNSFTPMDERPWPRGVPSDEVDPFSGAPFSATRDYLGIWAWREGLIHLLGATRDIELEIEYLRQFDPFTGPDDEVPIPWAIDAIAWCVLFMVALARGAPDAYRDRCSAMAEQQLSQMMNINVQRDQIQRRYRPAHYRGRF